MAEACISAIDGRRILCNGKHVTAALKRVHSQIMEVEACPPKENWLGPELERVFKEGLRVDVLEYPSDDRAHFYAIQCLAHEAEQNKFAPTSLKDKAKLVLRMHMRSTGGDWAQTQRALVEILGATKRTTVFRWVVIARDFDTEVLAYLGPRCKVVPQDFVVGNKYLMGRGEEHRFKLSPKCAKIVFGLVFGRMGMGINISMREFAQEFCCPLKHVETWEKAGRGDLGEAHP